MCGVEEIFGVALAATGKTQTVQTITGEVELPANDRASEIPTTEAMSELATRVMRNWRTNVDHRMTSGVDAKLKKALLAQTCNYTAEQKAKLRKAGVSEDIYIRRLPTRRFVRLKPCSWTSSTRTAIIRSVCVLRRIRICRRRL